METPVEATRRRSFRHQLPATTPNSATHPFFSNQVLLHDWWLIKVDSDSQGKRLGIGGFTMKEGIETIRCFSSTSIVKSLDAVTLKTDDGMTVMLLGCVNKSRTLTNGFSLEICNHFLIGFPYDWEEYADLSVSEEAANLSPSLDTDLSVSEEAANLSPSLDTDLSVSEEAANLSPSLDTDMLSRDETKKETSLAIRSMGSQKYAVEEYADLSVSEEAANLSPSLDTNALSTDEAKKETSLPIKSKGPQNDGKIKGGNVEHSGPRTRSRARLLDN